MTDQLPHKRCILPGVRRAVVKVGSSILSSAAGIDDSRIRGLVAELNDLATRACQIVLVSSGAVTAGWSRLGLAQRPRNIPQMQAAAAVGQIRLMALYEKYFATYDRQVAQVLLTHDDLANRRRNLNARHAFEALLRADVLPVVNENDTVVVREMKDDFGDNDNLSALVATLVDADLLVMLSDVPGLHTADPGTHGEAELIPLVDSVDARIRRCVGASDSELGTGGMRTKLDAAHTATRAGIACVIADGRKHGELSAVFDPAVSIGTLFLPSGDRLAKRKHWIAHTLKPLGTLVLDSGAADALRDKGRSLLPSGVTQVEGAFGAGDCVSVHSRQRREFARGLVNYGAADLNKIRGLQSCEIKATLGYRIADEVIHRDNLVLL